MINQKYVTKNRKNNLTFCNVGDIYNHSSLTDLRWGKKNVELH